MSVRLTLQVFALTVLSSLAGYSQEWEKPACTRDLAGQFWPLEANTDSRLLKKYARCGQLEICTRRAWRYQWRQATVTVNQLRKRSVPAAGCEESAGGPDSRGSAPKAASRPGT